VIVGVDEAGRGPLAGPVVAAAVILCPGGINGLDDSKKLSAARRAVLDNSIRSRCRFGIGQCNEREIDALNILQATLLAMMRAVASLGQPFDRILVDGNRLPDWPWQAQAIVGGDAIHPAISAASIVAKEHRDRIMRSAAKDYPHYGWERNMGYGTREHLAALKQYGPSPLHRKSFAPVAQVAR
jgi:ribonuclease HII